jgi:hypothetical protein
LGWDSGQCTTPASVDRLDHATVAVTLDTYGYAFPAMQEEALIAGPMPC